jgi:hypothetical protein
MWVEVYLIIVLVLVAITSLSHGHVPYFPIEISRLAADGSVYTRNIFSYGLLMLPIIVIVMDETKRWWTLEFAAAFFSLQLVTFFDDVHYWSIHMLGVAGLGLSATAYVYTHASYRTFFILFTAGILWCIRLALKLGVLWWTQPTGTNYPALARQIMYNGQCERSDVVLSVFRVCGVMQWVVFGILLQLPK